MVDPADKDPRLYIKVHNGMPEHPKIEGLSDAAFRLLVSTWCWSDRNNTDGAVPEKSRRKRGTPKAWRELFDAGLAEPATDGAMMHDYLEHQRSAAEKVARREAAQRSGQKGGKARAEAQALAKQTLERTGSKIQAEVEIEKEIDLTYVDREGGSSVPREPQAHPHPQAEPSPNCPAHPTGTTDPCGPCGRAKAALADWRAEERRRQSIAASEAAKERARLVKAAVDRCTLCDHDGRRPVPDGLGPVCDHIHRQPGALARARASAAQPESRTA